ncbi:hypothetical protein N3K63_09385 [Microbacterium sp. W1N]|uniref:hypothetical protein n=1 Tax=Microbacterium festucae TaxID=2977531 RepID=UPI0021C0CC97|nr:hypothetical protein [Microbacterium festucae]MCT9820492.1 hypothetical protein [Microbacterium festucae]
MSDTSETPLPATPTGPDLEELREEIDELKDQTTEELVSPTPVDLADREPQPEPTDAIGSEDWGDKR